MKLPKSLVSSTLASIASLLVISSGFVAAQVPQIINYQGRISAGGTPYTGVGQFKFALVSTDGSATYWSNDGTSTAGSQPTASVSLPTAAGLYVAPLGDTTIAGMLALPPSVFSNNGVKLRVWFNDGTNGSQQLAPDQQVLSVAYAMMAAGVPNAAITTAMIAPGAVTSDKLATDSSIPPGTILPYGGTNAPAGYLICDGATYSKTSYSALSAVLDNGPNGSAFGGTTTTFNVPDLRGRFLRGMDGPTLRDPDRNSRTAMSGGGNTGNAVGSIQSAAFTSHTHGPGSYATNSAGSHVHNAPGGNSYLTPNGTGANIPRNGSFFGGEAMNPAGDHSHTVTGGSSSATGGNETRPINAYVNYIIKF